MKTLIVYYHPNDRSFCSAILKAVKDGSKKGGHPSKVINMSKDNFDPVMKSKDLKAFAELGRGQEDALMKGFVDKVIFPGVAYDMDNGRLRPRLHSLKQVTVITTMNTPVDIYRNNFGNSLEGSLVKGTLNQIGINDIRWISLNMVKQSGDEKCWLWLDEIENEFAK